MKRIECFLVLWLCLTGFARAAHAPPTGLVIYCEPPATYRVAREFADIERADHLSKLVLPDGRVEEIPTGGILGIIKYPNSAFTPTQADEAIKMLKGLLARTSEREAQAKLQVALSKWTNAQAIAAQNPPSASGSPALRSNSSRTLAIDGVKYSEVSLTGFADGVITITHSEGIAKLAAAKLTTEQIALLNATSTSVRIAGLRSPLSSQDAVVSPSMRGRASTPAAPHLEAKSTTDNPKATKLIRKSMSGNFSSSLEVRDDDKVLSGKEYYLFKPGGTVDTIRLFTLNGLSIPPQRHSGTYELSADRLLLHLTSDSGKTFDSNLSIAADGTITNPEGIAWKTEGKDLSADQLADDQNRNFWQQSAIGAGLDAGKKYASSGRPVPTRDELDRLTDEKFAVAEGNPIADPEFHQTLRKAFVLGFERGYRKASEPAF